MIYTHHETIREGRQNDLVFIKWTLCSNQELHDKNLLFVWHNLEHKLTEEGDFYVERESIVSFGSTSGVLKAASNGPGSWRELKQRSCPLAFLARLGGQEEEWDHLDPDREIT